jgi:hypothetical protein
VGLRDPQAPWGAAARSLQLQLRPCITSLQVQLCCLPRLLVPLQGPLLLWQVPYHPLLLLLLLPLVWATWLLPLLLRRGSAPQLLAAKRAAAPLVAMLRQPPPCVQSTATLPHTTSNTAHCVSPVADTQHNVLRLPTTGRARSTPTPALGRSQRCTAAAAPGALHVPAALLHSWLRWPAPRRAGAQRNSRALLPAAPCSAGHQTGQGATHGAATAPQVAVTPSCCCGCSGCCCW